MFKVNFFESENVELKETVSDKLIKEIVAFANTKGGNIYIGVSDLGKVIGIENAQRELEKISNMISDSIYPDITFMISMEVIHIENKDIICLKIIKGPSIPYYITSKGMNEKGVFVRVGNTSRPATKLAIRNMIMESESVTFESNISINQNLSFSKLDENLKEFDIMFNKNISKTLGITTNEGLYTNLALLLSDECPFSIKVAMYKDNSYEEFIDRKEFTGSLLKQIDNVIEYLNMNNKIKSEITKINRIDTFDYPIKAIREAVLNSVLHRDYNINASIVIHIFKDSIKIVSLGSLYGDITLNDILSGGISVTRNPKLQSLLLRLNKVESLGTGIPRIIENYSLNEKKPEIILSDNVFAIILPKLNDSSNNKLNYMESVMSYLNENKYITREEIEILLAVGKTRALEILNEMLESNIIKTEGRGRAKKYIIKNK